MWASGEQCFFSWRSHYFFLAGCELAVSSAFLSSSDLTISFLVGCALAVSSAFLSGDLTISFWQGMG